MIIDTCLCIKYGVDLKKVLIFFIGLCYWFRILSRFDCGGSYDIRVELLDQKKQLIEIFSPETIYCGTRREEWKQVWHKTLLWKPKDNFCLTDYLFFRLPMCFINMDQEWDTFDLHVEGGI